MRIAGLVLDFDGLILDTELPAFRAWADVYERHGCPPLTLEEWAADLGTHGRLDPVAVLAERTGLDLDAADVHRLRRARRDELLAGERVLPGVEAWLDEADELGIPVAVASSSQVDWVGGHLGRLGLAARIRHLSCYGAGLPAKPAPDLYLDACRAIGVAPARALAVEDSPNGVAAARAAGMRCVAVPNQLTVSLDLSAADVVLPSLSTAGLAEVAAALA